MIVDGKEVKVGDVLMHIPSCFHLEVIEVLGDKVAVKTPFEDRRVFDITNFSWDLTDGILYRKDCHCECHERNDIFHFEACCVQDEVNNEK